MCVCALMSLPVSDLCIVCVCVSENDAGREGNQDEKLRNGGGKEGSKPWRLVVDRVEHWVQTPKQ